MTSRPTLVFIEHKGTEHRVQVEPGTSVMQAALDASVPGILADCGGACACGTCHAYMEGEAVARLEPASSSERDMVECAIDPLAHSRLTCQIVVRQELDGLVIRLPRSQV
jgi:2Fe-2S ferredoxin